MKIRSVTIFNGRPDAHERESILHAGRAAQTIGNRLREGGFEVQTTRLALAPAHRWIRPLNAAESLDRVKSIEASLRESGIDYVSLGPIATSIEHVDELKKLPALIAATSGVFFSAVMADELQNVNAWSLRPIAEAVKEISTTTENGFGNLRFAALAHCAPGIPFFPAAYAEADDFSCALAIECADLALNCATESRTVSDFIAALSRCIEGHDRRITDLLNGASADYGVEFRGCDWSLAPHPDASCSIGAAIEKLSGAAFGEWGTLTAVAALTRGIRNANVRHVGFSGVFLPLLEDAILAQRTTNVAELQKLLLYSAVCGSGLDTVPLAGDVSVDAMAALLGDVATLSSVLRKPLTARLMPIVGVGGGEMTRFDFPFLVNGRALTLSGNAPGICASERICFA